MGRIVYVSGRYLPYAQAGVHVEDRGFQLGDAVYEVCEVRGGAIVDLTRHLARLERSLGELLMPQPMSRAALTLVIARTIRLNRVTDGTVYLQVSRGASPRDFYFPKGDVAPTVVVIARPKGRAANEALAQTGIGVVTADDIRWGRCDIKTVMLLPACLAKEAARREGAREAWLVDEAGMVTEGASSNAWIVDEGGKVITRPVGREILAGVTRATALDVLRREGIAVEERPFSVAEARAAREAFITSASNIVMPVVKIDGREVGNGRPGPIAQRIRTLFHQVAEMVTSGGRGAPPLV